LLTPLVMIVFNNAIIKPLKFKGNGVLSFIFAVDRGAVQRAVGSAVRPVEFAKDFSILSAVEQARMRAELAGLRKLLQSLELAIGPG